MGPSGSDLGRFGPNRPPRGPSGQPLGALLLRFGALLGLSCGFPKPLLWFLEPSWGARRPSWNLLKSLLGCQRSILEVYWAVVGLVEAQEANMLNTFVFPRE